MPAGPRRNRVDPFGDLHAVPGRGLFTGNRGCLVDEEGELARHHRGDLWITCLTSYREWSSPLAQPGHWTPLFFLDDSVALAAGHRPCGLCRREDYLAYKEGVGGWAATRINRQLAAERLRRGRGMERADHRELWWEKVDALPDGTVVVDERGRPLLVRGELLWRFDFEGWRDPTPRPVGGEARVLTPPTSVRALRGGFQPVIHPSATVTESGRSRT